MPEVQKGKRTRYWLGLLALSAVALPLSFVLTILVHPVWSWIETNSGMEAMGHSGPADWCFWTVFGLVELGLIVVWTWRRRR